MRALIDPHIQVRYVSLSATSVSFIEVSLWHILHVFAKLVHFTRGDVGRDSARKGQIVHSDFPHLDERKLLPLSPQSAGLQKAVALQHLSISKNHSVLAILGSHAQ